MMHISELHIAAKIYNRVLAAAEATERIEAFLQRRPHANRDTCRYCGSDDDVCQVCGCCSPCHILMMVDAVGDQGPEVIRQYGLNMLVLHETKASGHGPDIDHSMAYIADAESMHEELPNLKAKRMKEIEEEGPRVDNEVWGDAIDHLFDD